MNRTCFGSITRHSTRIALALTLVLVPSVVSAATLYGLINTGELFRSTNSGVTWTAISTLPVHDAVALAARLSSSDLFLVSRSGGVYRSLNAGMSWTAVGSISAGDATDLMIRPDGGLFVLSASGSLYRSTDLGTTFSGVATLTASNFVSLSFTTGAPAVKYYALTRTGEVYESVNGGINWTPKGTMAVSDAARIRTVQSTLYVMTDTGDVYRSTDAAATWTAVGTLSQVGMRGLVRNGTSLVAASREGHVATSTNGVSWTWQGSMNQLALTALASDEPAQTGVGPEIPPVGVFLTPPYPNPSRGPAEFEIRLDTETDVRFSLFDVTGRLAAARGPEHLAEGQHLIKWTPGVPHAGIYFLRVEAGNGPSATARWVILE